MVKSWMAVYVRKQNVRSHYIQSVLNHTPNESICRNFTVCSQIKQRHFSETQYKAIIYGITNYPKPHLKMNMQLNGIKNAKNEKVQGVPK